MYEVLYVLFLLAYVPAAFGICNVDADAPATATVADPGAGAVVIAWKVRCELDGTVPFTLFGAGVIAVTTIDSADETSPGNAPSKVPFPVRST